MATLHMGHRDWETRANTYHRFMLGLKWVLVCLATVIVLLTTWFGAGAGFFPALILAAIVFAIGAWAMNHGLNHSTEREWEEIEGPR